MFSSIEKELAAPRDLSSTLIKGMSVLAAFDEAHRALTMPEIVRLTGLDRASVRRLVMTLVHLGYLEKAGRSFSLTPRVLRHAGAYLRGNQIGAVVQPILNRHAEELGNTISLAVLDDALALYIAQSTLENSTVSYGFTVGSRLPVLPTAVGRMLLACLEPETARAIIRDTPVERFTSATETDRLAIARAVAVAGEKGFSVVRGEFEAGATGLAVPVGSVARSRLVVGMSDHRTGAQTDEDLAAHIVILQRCASALDRAAVL